MNLGAYFKAVEKSPRNYLNLWIEDGPVRAYCRYIATHYINNRLRHCFDLATVMVDESKQRQGHFKKFLKKLENLSPHPIRVENVGNEHLALFLEKEGYIIINDYSSIPSYFNENEKTL